jgi:hypothetical protein
MPVYASIRRERSVRVAGSQQTGWKPVLGQNDPATLMSFDFAITDDGNGQCLLIYRSKNGRYFGDDWYETLERAYAAAEQRFGIARDEWTTT